MEITNVKMWVGDMEVEQAAVEQITNISTLPILAGHIAIMPDVHMGKGATVGSVIPTRSAIIPAAVGVDIGCGMCAVMTNLVAEDLPDSLFALRNQIERDVPVGFNEHKAGIPSVSGPYADILRKNLKKTMDRYDHLALKAKLGRADEKRIGRQIGTLGGGNHFIEICLDLDNRVWVMLHSGSRGIGNQIGTVAIEMAKKQGAVRGWGLPDQDLAWLSEGSADFDAYIEAMHWAQDYARFNRDTMMNLVLAALKHRFPQMVTIGEVVNCHHNFTSWEEHNDQGMWITRKGAVSARTGELGIIPGSMGAKSFIVRGKGNKEAYCSCSHGAGRKMSRNQAKKLFTSLDLANQTAGVECRKDDGVVDEIPGAYKDIDQVMAAQADLVDIVTTLKQVLCIKG
jgi:tRNA-splicing ligase RtcB (3'-phosphate/5'-hydroxy nucleic acid ligase)